MISILALISLISSPIPALKDLQATMGKVQSFKASFQQTVKQDLFPEAAETAKGRVLFSRPNQLDWIYESPKKRRITFDGKELIIEDDRGEKQIIHDRGRITLEKSFSFLWGQPDESLFALESKSREKFRVRPRRPQDVSFEWIDVTVKKGKVASALVHDKLGGESLLEFIY